MTGKRRSVRDLRKAAGLTQEQLAARAWGSRAKQPIVSRVERGKGRPHEIEHLRQVLAGHTVSLHDEVPAEPARRSYRQLPTRRRRRARVETRRAATTKPLKVYRCTPLLAWLPHRQCLINRRTARRERDRTSPCLRCPGVKTRLSRGQETDQPREVDAYSPRFF